MFINVHSNTVSWLQATKKAEIRAVSVNEAMIPAIMNHVKLVTLEGDELIGTRGSDSFICVGVKGEMWMQSRDSLFEKYTKGKYSRSTGLTQMIPKSGNVVNTLQVTKEWCDHQRTPITGDKFCLSALWGEMTPDGKFTQTGTIGDWVCQNTQFPDDVWIVDDDIFHASYVLVN